MADEHDRATSGPSDRPASDESNGYDTVADAFIAARSTAGRDVVERWAASLPRPASVLDVGAGSGEPLTSALIDGGLSVSALDASPRMVAAFRRRFPDVDVACESVEGSRFFGRTFDAVLVVGLIFLLPAPRQRALIGSLADVLEPGGRLLFSAPREVAVWTDVSTGRTSRSLGAAEYRRLLVASGLHPIGTTVDEGGNHYHDARKRHGGTRG